MPNFSLKDQVVFEAARQFATPFHLYSERGIRQTARALKDAFDEIEDFREYFAVKALPTPAVLRILKEEGCGVDCASATELMLADACGFQGGDIMFSANDVTGDEFALARRLGAYINLDDITHVDTLAQNGGVPGNGVPALQSRRHLPHRQRHHGRPRRRQVRHDAPAAH